MPQIKISVFLLIFATLSVFSQNTRIVTPSIDTFQGKYIGESVSAGEPMMLWYRRPAADWNGALPIGNGRIGAMIFGGIEGERLQLNEDTLWSGSPYDPSNPEALQALPEVRKLIFEGKYKEAETLIQAKMMAKPIRQQAYQTIGDLRLAFPKTDSVENYRRDLNLDTAIAKVTYKINGVTFTREMFSTAADNVIAMKISADKRGQVSFDSAFQSPQTSEVLIENGNELVLSGKNAGSFGINGRLKFQTRAKLINQGGTISPGCGKFPAISEPYSAENGNPKSVSLVKSANSCISIKNADSVTILISAATNFKRFDDISGDETNGAKKPLSDAAKKNFNALKAAHIADYQKFFRRVSINIGSPKGLPTDERIRNFAAGGDPDFAALYYQFGRYLLISSSRPGTQPANLQGIWNDTTSPPWGSKYTININTEMNYWLAEITNLSELTEPLTKMVEEAAITGAKTAKTNYGARGWVTHHNLDLWRATAPIDAAFYGTWTTGGAWLTTHLWEHYEYTGDRQYLKRVYPVMKGSAEFFVDFLVEDPLTKYLVTAPSMSPENRHQFDSSIVAGATMDMQIIRDLFTQTIEAAKTLGLDKEFQTLLAQKLARLAPNKIGKAGQLQEWQEDWDLQAKDLKHRHVSHLYGAYPSWQINIYDTPELANAANKTLDMRGDLSTGWAIAWRLNLWARLGDAERTYKILTNLLTPERTYPNMFDAHPPFQIDGNFGGTSGITEMLMQNRLKNDRTEIILLPSLPQAFSNGSIKGLRARGGFEINIEWKNGRLVNAGIRSLLGKTAILRYGGKTKEINLKKGQTIKWNGVS